KAEPLRLVAAEHAEDVRMHVQLARLVHAEPADDAADQPPAGPRPGDVVARMRERAQDVAVDRRVARPFPHDREELRDLIEVRELGELLDRHDGSRIAQRRSGPVSMPASASAARTAAATPAAPAVSPCTQ